MKTITYKNKILNIVSETPIFWLILSKRGKTWNPKPMHTFSHWL